MKSFKGSIEITIRQKVKNFNKMHVSFNNNFLQYK